MVSWMTFAIKLSKYTIFVTLWLYENYFWPLVKETEVPLVRRMSMGMSFFYIMPSNMGPQRAASNRVHEQLVIIFEELCPCATV